jgi:hypothetical protein
MMKSRIRTFVAFLQPHLPALRGHARANDSLSD